MKEKDKPPEGKKFYGSVTVSERGQIVVPASARKDFNIKTGDKLLIFGDLEQGLWITTFPIIQKNLTGSMQLFIMAHSSIKNKTDCQV